MIVVDELRGRRLGSQQMKDPGFDNQAVASTAATRRFGQLNDAKATAQKTCQGEHWRPRFLSHDRRQNGG
jgi:hypothetical protein